MSKRIFVLGIDGMSYSLMQSDYLALNITCRRWIQFFLLYPLLPGQALRLAVIPENMVSLVLQTGSMILLKS